MSEAYPAKRFSIAAAALKQAAALIRFGRAPDRDPTAHHLVALRASQPNDCAFCTDRHRLGARGGSAKEARRDDLDARRETPLCDDRERAALGEAVTQTDRAGVPDEVWAAAQAQFEEPELAQLLSADGATNTWNRPRIATRALPGHYPPPAGEAGKAVGAATKGGASAAGASATNAAAAGARR